MTMNRTKNGTKDSDERTGPMQSKIARREPAYVPGAIELCALSGRYDVRSV